MQNESFWNAKGLVLKTTIASLLHSRSHAAEIRYKSDVAVDDVSGDGIGAVVESVGCHDGLGPVALSVAVDVTAVTYYEFVESEAWCRNSLNAQRFATLGCTARHSRPVGKQDVAVESAAKVVNASAERHEVATFEDTRGCKCAYGEERFFVG